MVHCLGDDVVVVVRGLEVVGDTVVRGMTLTLLKIGGAFGFLKIGAISVTPF